MPRVTNVATNALHAEARNAVASVPDGAYLLVPTNCRGEWASRYAAVLRWAYPHAFRTYRNFCINEDLDNTGYVLPVISSGDADWQTDVEVKWDTDSFRKPIGRCLVIPNQTPSNVLNATMPPPSHNIVCLFVSFATVRASFRINAVDRTAPIRLHTQQALEAFRNTLPQPGAQPGSSGGTAAAQVPDIYSPCFNGVGVPETQDQIWAVFSANPGIPINLTVWPF